MSVHFSHVARPFISHVFALEKIFPAQGQPVNFTRRRPFRRRPFILHMFFFWRGSFLHRPSPSTLPRDGHPPAHSFISPRFCSGENFFSPEQPINFNRWGSFVPRRSLPAAARFTLQIHFFHDYVRHFRPSSIPSYVHVSLRATIAGPSCLVLRTDTHHKHCPSQTLLTVSASLRSARHTYTFKPAPSPKR